MAQNLPGRARVIYQSEALYAGTVDATGHHFSVSNDAWSTKSGVAKLAEAFQLATKSEQESSSCAEYKTQIIVLALIGKMLINLAS